MGLGRCGQDILWREWKKKRERDERMDRELVRE